MSGKGDPKQRGRKGWGNQGGGDGGNSGNGGNQRPAQNQAPPNFADSNAFGPPLGARARPNRNAGPAPSNAPTPVPQSGPPSAWGRPAPSAQQPPAQRAQQPAQRAQQPAQRAQPPARSSQAGPSTGPTPSSRQPAAPAPAAAAGPSAWGQPKRGPDSETSSGSATKYHSDERTQGEAARGAIHGNRPERNPSDYDVVVTRPKHIEHKQGSTGTRDTTTRMVVTSNYFRVLSKFKWEVHQYHIDFTPEIEHPSFKNALLVRNFQAILGGFLFDRGSNIYTLRRLENEVTEVVTRDRDDREILIKVKHVGLISPLEARSVQVLNTFMKRVLKELNLQRVGRDYFDTQASIDIPQHHIQLWPGYTTSIKQHEKELLLLGEIRHKLMRTETLLDVLRQCHSRNRQNFMAAFQSEVLGMIVLTRYNNKTYRITDVLDKQSPKDEFSTKDGPITYINYYKQRFGITIQDVNQPLLVSTPTDKDIRGARGRDEQVQAIHLIPELCTPTGYTDEMRKNFNLMKDVAVHTRVGPRDRIQKLLNFNRRIYSTERSMECFRDWSMSLDQNLVKIDSARALPSENILLGNDRKFPAERGDWTRSLQGSNSMYRSESLPKDSWVVIIPENMRRDVDQFIQTILNVSRGMHFNVDQPRKVYVNDDRQTTLSAVLNNECNLNPKLIMIAVSNNNADRYSVIKRICTVQYAIPSQVVTRRIMDPKRMMSIATKVAIQMNSKIGGLPWNVAIPLSDCMFIGYDVCHDTCNKSKSYGALVATIDLHNKVPNQRTKFLSCVNAHTDGQELSNFLSMGVISALKEYQMVHGKLPSRIMFYRDGVGEGQLKYVYDHELQRLLSSLRQYMGTEPKLGFIVVSKRINTKFFLEGRGGVQNVPAGTIVDDVVTLPEFYDFFLVSQHVTQGTATPTNYNVIYDNFGLPPDKVQVLTYKMCHLYFNWSGTTRVPAVCQYAHKLAFLAGNFLHNSPSRELNKYLYFL